MVLNKYRIYTISLISSIFVISITSIILLSVDTNKVSHIQKKVEAAVQDNHQILPHQYVQEGAYLPLDDTQYNKQYQASISALQQQLQLTLASVSSNTTLKLSSQALYNISQQFCSEFTQECVDNQFYPQFLVIHSDYFSQKISPELWGCPSSDYSSECGQLSECLGVSSLKYEVLSHNNLNSLSNIKSAILNNESVIIQVPKPIHMVEVPCVPGFGLQDVENCVTCKTIKLGQKCDCLQLSFPHQDAQIGTDIFKNQTEFFHVVGYNDEFVFKNGEKGALIIRSEAENSHSADFLGGVISQRAEEFLCPNFYSVFSWVPLDQNGTDDFKLRNITVLSYVGYWQQQSNNVPYLSIEKVLDGLLNRNHFYVLKSSQKLGQNIYRVDLDETTSIQQALDHNFSKVVTLPALPLEILSKFFIPQYQQQAINTDNCGFRALPYSYFSNIQQNYQPLLGDALKLRFSENKREGLYLDFINNATKSLKLQKFISHTPWLENETFTPKFK